jgi:hypothetical protein
VWGSGALGFPLLFLPLHFLPGVRRKGEVHRVIKGGLEVRVSDALTSVGDWRGLEVQGVG